MTDTHQPSDTRDRILTAALTLFSENGYDATSVTQICQAAEASKGAFYHHFPSKQDLFLTLMTQWLGDIEGLFQHIGQGAANVPQALDRIASASGRVFEHLEGGFPILLEFWTQASRQPVVWEKAVEPYRHFLDYFSDLIRAGIAEGSFDPDADPVLNSRILMAIAMGLLLQASFDPQGADWHHTTRAGVHLLLDSLRRIP